MTIEDILIIAETDDEREVLNAIHEHLVGCFLQNHAEAVVAQAFYSGFIAYEGIQVLWEADKGIFNNHIWIKNISLLNGKVPWDELVLNLNI